MKSVSPEDTVAVLEAVNAGIKFVITTHGHTFADIKKTSVYARILMQHIFERFIELNRRDKSAGAIRILDETGNAIHAKEVSRAMIKFIGAAAYYTCYNLGGFESAREIKCKDQEQLRQLKVSASIAGS